jgi:hypothetical protein
MALFRRELARARRWLRAQVLEDAFDEVRIGDVGDHPQTPAAVRALGERARQRLSSTGAGGEWSGFVDAFQALCLAGMGERQRSLDLAHRCGEQATNDTARPGRVVRACVLRMVSGSQHLDELEAQIVETLEVLLRTDAKGLLPVLLLERAGLARLRGDTQGMARDLTEARSLFAQMGVTGWDEYGRSIEA